MAFLRCDDYGHDCNYAIKGDDDIVIDSFWEHMNDEHGIDYSKGKIWELLKRKEQKLIQIQLK